MSLVMHVDTAAWRSHQDAVLAGDRLTVPVIKGNGYGFGLERLAGEAARLEADVVAVGTAGEVAAVRAGGFTGNVVVLTPWRPGDPIVEQMLADIDLDAQTANLSGGERRRAALVALMLGNHDLLVLDEPFESVDPVSAANIEDVLRSYTATGGTVIVSSHSMDLVQRMCDHVAVMDQGRVLAQGTMDEVRAGMSLEDRFVSLVGGRTEAGEGLQWLRPE